MKNTIDELLKGLCEEDALEIQNWLDSNPGLAVILRKLSSMTPEARAKYIASLQALDE